MEKYVKASIYFDTNTFERRHSGKELFLNTIEPSELYYSVRDAVTQLELSEQVKFYVPEIVCREIKQHLKEKFKATIDSFESKIDEVKKSCGDLIDIHYELKGLNTISDYAAYVEEIFAEFLNNPRNMINVADCPRDEQIFDGIIEKAVGGLSPFHKVKINGKEYTDAGLKDALIWETIKTYSRDELVIFVTNDSDFEKIHESNVVVCSTSVEVKKILIDNMEIAPDALFKNRLLTDDDYLLKQILEESEFNEYKTFKVESIKQSHIDSDELGRQTLYVVFVINIDNVSYEFTIRYDLNANELFSVDHVEPLD